MVFRHKTDTITFEYNCCLLTERKNILLSHNVKLRCIGSVFSISLRNGNSFLDFLVAFLDKEILPRVSQLLQKERTRSVGNEAFLKEEKLLALKAPITAAADDIHKYFFIVFRENNT